MKVLDACASPGGKTTAMAAMADDRAEIVASDVRSARVQLLRDNRQRERRAQHPHPPGRSRGWTAVRAHVRSRVRRRAVLGPRHGAAGSGHSLAAHRSRSHAVCGRAIEDDSQRRRRRCARVGASFTPPARASRRKTTAWWRRFSPVTAASPGSICGLKDRRTSMRSSRCSMKTACCAHRPTNTASRRSTAPSCAV